MNNKALENNSITISAEYLSRRESAAFLRISLASFDKIRDIERIKYGKTVRFSIQALREYAIKHTQKGVENDNQ